MVSLLDNIARPSAVILQLSVVLGVIFVLLKVVKFYQERKKIVKALEAFPGPPKHWLYGHNHVFTSDKILNLITSLGEEYPYAFPRWFGPVLSSLVVHHPEYAKTILGRGAGELHMELNISFNELETMMEMLEHCKVYTMLVSQVLTQLQKKHNLQVCQDLLNPKEAEEDSFLDHIITTDKTWCHNYEPESKQQSMEWRVVTCEFPIKENVHDAALNLKPNVPYNFLVPWIGKGLLILNGNKWFQHRKLLTPAFHYDVLKSYVPLMSDSVKVMLDKWEKNITEKKKSVELFQDVSLMTLDSIMKCAFSYNSNCQTQSNSDSYIKAVFDMSYLINKRIQAFSYQDAFYDLTRSSREFQDACRQAHAHTDKVIKERKILLSNDKELDKILMKRHLDFLDILLCAKDENGAGLSDEDLRAEVDTFMFEGHDTTASGISWLLYSMALHPEHQARCREEIQGIMGNRDTIEWEDLGKMTYSTMCIKESLRLFPPVPSISRRLSKPITFSDGRSLPEGSQISLHIFGIHRNRDVWEDPEVFDPLRFSPENSAHRHSHAFLPFSAGPRNCIGQQFAMNEMKVALALTLLRFELFPNASKPPTLTQQLILKSSSGIHLHLKKIH